jgi:hypothetical protein
MMRFFDGGSYNKEGCNSYKQIKEAIVAWSDITLPPPNGSTSPRGEAYASVKKGGVILAGDLRNNKEHTKQCHDRWIEKRNRKQEDPSYLDEWYDEQCGGCIYFIPLMGDLADDYGACSNPQSEFDGIIRFEHDGCGKHEQAEEWT